MTYNLMNWVYRIFETALKKGQMINRPLIREFLTLLNQPHVKPEMMNALTKILNLWVRHRWAASLNPIGGLAFPVYASRDPKFGEIDREEDETHESGWALSFCLPPLAKSEGRFTLAIWVSLWSVHQASSPLPMVVLGFGRLSLELLRHRNQVALGVTCRSDTQRILIGSTKFEEIVQRSDSPWSFLVFNITLFTEALQVEIFVDGYRSSGGIEKINLKMAHLSSDEVKHFPPSFHIGTLVEESDEEDDEHEEKGEWEYAQSWIFSRLLTEKEVLLWYLMGPSLRSREDARFQKPLVRPSLWRQVMAQGLSSVMGVDFAWNDETMEERWRSIIESLSRSVIFAHSADMKTTGIAYFQDKNTASRGLFSSLFQSGSSPTDLSELRSATLSSINHGFDLHWNTRAYYEGSCSHALEMTGGPQLLLLILSRVLENQACDETVAVTLNAIFWAQAESLPKQNGIDLSLIGKILQCAQPHQLGPKVMQVMLDHSLTQPILLYDKGRKLWGWKEASVAVIHRHSIFSLFVKTWKIWRENESPLAWDGAETQIDVSQLALMCLRKLIHDMHPFREVNVKTLRQMGLVKKLTTYFLMDSDRDFYPIILEIFGALIGSPPELSVVEDLMQAALLLHDPAHTYIRHARHSFYFNLPSSASRGRSMTHFTQEPETQLTKSASFAHHLEAEAVADGFVGKKEADVEPRQDSISPISTIEVPFNPVANRFQKVLSSVKRNTHRKPAADTEPQYSHGLHFGHLSRLESMTIEAGQDLANRLSRSKLEEIDITEEDEPVEDEVFDAPYRPPTNAIEGLLRLLYGALLNIPDSAITAVTMSVVLPEYVLTLMNHPEAWTRLAAVQLLVKYVQRSTRYHSDGYRMEKIHGYYLMAGQIFSWECPEAGTLDAIACALLSLIHGSEVSSTSRLPELPTRGARIRPAALPALLSLLPLAARGGSAHLASLHALIVHLHDMTARVQNFLPSQYERLSLFEALCKTLETLWTSPKELWTSDVEDHDGRDILFKDLDYLLRFIGKSLSY